MTDRASRRGDRARRDRSGRERSARERSGRERTARDRAPRERGGREPRARAAREAPDEARTGRRRGGAGARPAGAAAGSPSRPKRPARTVAPPTRRRRRRLIIGGLVVVLVAAALVWLTVFSPVLDVREVRVVGATPEETEPVERAAAVGPGTSLLWLDGDDVAERVRTQPRIASVDVGRDWPGTLVVRVTEREPVLAVPRADGFVLVDATGFAYRTAATRPTGVPVLVLPGGVLPSPDEPGTRAAADVVVALPDALRADVTEVRGNGPFDVGFVLTGGREVRWGADADNERKAAVLGALLSRPGTLYDVSTPQLAVVR